jgi:Helix-turn-helix domain
MSTRTMGVDQVAAELGASEEWVRRQCRAGRFPHHRIARRLRFTDEDLAAILAVMAVPVITPPELELVDAPPAPSSRRRYAVYPR